MHSQPYRYILFANIRSLNSTSLKTFNSTSLKREIHQQIFQYISACANRTTSTPSQHHLLCHFILCNQHSWRAVLNALNALNTFSREDWGGCWTKDGWRCPNRFRYSSLWSSWDFLFLILRHLHSSDSSLDWSKVQGWRMISDGIEFKIH